MQYCGCVYALVWQLICVKEKKKKCDQTEERSHEPEYRVQGIFAVVLRPKSMASICPLLPMGMMNSLYTRMCRGQWCHACS